MCLDFMGNEIMNDVSQGNERRKSYTKQRVDIIIYIRGEF